MPEYICYKDCYYANTYFTVGDKLPSNLNPNKHFSVDGTPPKDIESPVLKAGDDPRSTIQMLEDLKKEYPDVEISDDATRKEIFEALVKANKLAERKEFVESIKTPVGNDKRFSEMTPDELYEMKVAEISEKVERLYKKELRYGGVKKDELLKQAIDIETGYYAKKIGANAE